MSVRGCVKRWVRGCPRVCVPMTDKSIFRFFAFIDPDPPPCLPPPLAGTPSLAAPVPVPPLSPPALPTGASDMRVRVT